jgi:hypothetical protein
MTTLIDTVRIEVPMRSPVQPAGTPGPPAGQRLPDPPSVRSRSRSRGGSLRMGPIGDGPGQSLWREAA